jgi:hypothetical protein
MRTLLPALLFAATVGLLPAEILVFPFQPLRPLPPTVADDEDPSLPGRGAPAAPVGEAIYDIIWSDGLDTRSLLLVEGTGGMLAAATIITVVNDQPQDDRKLTLRVFYRGRVFIDAQGRAQFDCRWQPVFGPDRESWSPDSFTVIERTAQVVALDDRGNGSTGRLLRVIRPASSDYRQLRRIVDCFLTGIL